MIGLTIVWCTAVVLATPQNQNSLPTISNSLPSELYASSTSGAYVSRRNRFSIRFSNLSAMLSPTVDRCELLIRVLDSTLDVPSVHYRNRSHLTELRTEQNLQDGMIQVISLNRDVVYGLSRGLDLIVTRNNLDIHDSTTPMLVAYGDNSHEVVDLQMFLGDDIDDSSRVKRDVTSNMVDPDDVAHSPCHLEELWMDFPKGMHPEIVNVRQCVGSCSSVGHSKEANSHTIVQAHLGVKRPGETHVPSCCVPVEFRSMFFEKDLRRKEVQNLIATKCGCR
ncbi:uncharacterized protein LOC134824110 [Bolinopsis microptera]|uniref:uncharacterized protein LOC134824110 n=1 Tax=Bolinopsis microptera TaxID=2820187 RepID=UPI003079336B